ncbi:NAD(P) transhydrogenase subunit alpha [Bacteroides propionicifaciens]|uniref:NAD(P) transhydrogenase subunit alpha n=1 Tax=Bacteroides propionicifaciens TaxID=392838 RepID=UPI0004680E06|nr:NAD(P) transhydrogenase subunit alpha [Bacteroides propionicifaciens]
MNPIYLILIFLITTILGYFIIKNVPSLLHTPLMSGMNALSGISLLGAILAVGISYEQDGARFLIGQIVGGISIILATINVVGGFGVTHRMLKMFNKKKTSKK